MPEDSVYGSWPSSGEIDLAEGRGNDKTYPGGRDRLSSTLHWGIDVNNDQWFRTTSNTQLKRGDFSDDFHTFGVEWSEDYIFTWVDNRNHKILRTPFGKKFGTMFDRGKFTELIAYGYVPVDVWSQTGRWNTPFDQEFYLILNVAVGATNGYFQDGIAGKPWVDGTVTAMRDFWRTNETWLSTWGEGEDRGMTVQSVRMWREGACA